MSQLLARHAPADPICFGPQGVRSAAELTAFSQAIARALPEHRPAAAVVITCRDRYAFMAALLAALGRGFRVMLPPNDQPATLRALSASADVVAQLRDDDGLGLDVRSLIPESPPASLAPL